MEHKKIPTFEECIRIIEYLYPSMHDYVYVYDIKKDLYQISPKAVEKFKIPSTRFSDVINAHKFFAYEEDYDSLVKDLQKVVSGEEDSHDLMYRWNGRDNNLYWIHCVGHAVKDENNKPVLLIGCVNEVGNANFADNVTGLLGYESFKSMLNSSLLKNKEGFVIKLCIDEMKTINEKYGFEYGNSILKRTADLINEVIGENQYCYKLTNDEYAVIDFVSSNVEDACNIYEQLRWKVSDDIVKRRYEGVYTLSAGLVKLSKADNDYNLVLKKLEFSLDTAIKRGRNQLYIYNDDDYGHFINKTQLIKALNEAVANDFKGFMLYYQPIVDANTNATVAAEALLRFKYENRIIPPLEFIPLLEETGLIVVVGRFIIKQSAKFCKKMREHIKDFRVSMNISYVQIIKGVQFKEYFKIIEKLGLPYDSIVIELTESGYLEDNQAVKSAWNKLKNDGIRLAIDDFGTGYSNIHNISMLSPNTIKIDMSLTKNALKTNYDFELLRNIVSLAHELKINVVVEGVETEEEYLKIMQINPDYIQGYYYSKPLPEDGFNEYIKK